MNVAHLLGMGLCCALGDTLEHCVTPLQTDAIPIGRLEVDGFDDPLRTAFYRIADGHDVFDPGRMARLLPPVVEAALDQAQLSAHDRRRLPVFVGSSSFTITGCENRYADALRRDPDSATAMPDVSFETVARIAADTAGSQGEIRSWHTACTSAANALLTAQRLLDAGLASHVLVIGIELANRTSLAGFSSMQLLADAIRPFDRTRSGIVLGEAIGAIVLGKDSGDVAPLRLLGGAANTDHHSVTGARPDGTSLAAVQARALALAKRHPDDIRAIKAHATSTPQNDLGEARSLHRVFAELPPVCALKSRLGHTLGACGVTELALFAGAIERGFVPATRGFAQPDPELDIRPTTTRRPAPSGSYLLNQFGFGGSNTSLVLELA